jgi:acetyl-CoA acetyltransferase
VQKLEESEEFAAEMGRKLKDVSGTSAKDWDIAEMYDGFLCIAPVWSEGCGVCKPGEFLDFIQGGRIEADGASPLNVSGGNNGNGRVQGIPMFYNPVEQIRGTAGKRQVKDAKVIASVMGPFGAGQGIVYGASPS